MRRGALIRDYRSWSLMRQTLQGYDGACLFGPLSGGQIGGMIWEGFQKAEGHIFKKYALMAGNDQSSLDEVALRWNLLKLMRAGGQTRLRDAGLQKNSTEDLGITIKTPPCHWTTQLIYGEFLGILHGLLKHSARLWWMHSPVERTLSERD